MTCRCSLGLLIPACCVLAVRQKLHSEPDTAARFGRLYGSGLWLFCTDTHAPPRLRGGHGGSLGGALAPVPDMSVLSNSLKMHEQIEQSAQPFSHEAS